MINFLADPSVVKGWAGLSLAQRAVMLHRQHPEVKITGAHLGNLYRELGIKRKRVVIKKFSNLKD